MPTADSGPPKPGVPDCMSVCDTNEPMIAGQPGPHQLHERQRGERLGRLLRERRRHRDGAHRAHQDERRDDHDLPALAISNSDSSMRMS